MNKIIQLFKENILIHTNVLNIINVHNDESYHKLTMFKGKSPVLLKIIKYSDINLLLNDFYNNYKYHHSFIEYVKDCLSQINYSEDDLFVHINRSNDYINHLFIKFNNQKKEIEEQLISLSENENEINNLFIEYNLSFSKIDMDFKYIDNLFKLFDDVHFVEIGYRLLLAFYNNKLLSIDIRSHMLPLVDDFKNKILEVKYKTKISYVSKSLQNNLQQFNLNADEMDNISLNAIVYKLFGSNHNDELTIKQLSELLKLESKKNNKEIGIVLIVKNNYTDSYFNISTLFNDILIKELTNVNGVTKNYIDTYNTLKIKNLDTVKDNQLMCFNISDTTEDIYILWSNDLINYKCKTDPITNNLLSKLLRNEPSIIINNYNKNIEQLILNNKNLQISQEFKKIKYYDFQLSLSSNDYLNKLCSNIEIVIKDLITQKSIDDITIMLKDKSLRNHIINIIAKSLKLINYKFSEYELALLLNIASSISQKIVRDLIYLLGNNKITTSMILKECPIIIKNRVFTNNTIYDKILNSYYLNLLSQNLHG